MIADAEGAAPVPSPRFRIAERDRTSYLGLEFRNPRLGIGNAQPDVVDLETMAGTNDQISHVLLDGLRPQFGCWGQTLSSGDRSNEGHASRMVKRSMAGTRAGALMKRCARSWASTT